MSSDRRTRPVDFRTVALACVVAVAGCGYGEVSPTTFQYAKALYSLSNRQAAERIDTVAAQIDTAVEAGELPTHEAEWLIAICEQCRAGDWKGAQAAARRIMEDQVDP